MRLAVILSVFLFAFLSFNTHYAECRPLQAEGLSAKEKVHTHLMIMFLSYAGDDRRQSLRETWLADDTNNKTQWVFVLGNIDNSPARENVHKEMQKYGDIIILNDVIDDYEHLSDKALKGFKEVHSRYVFDFLLKTDTDTFVLLPRLLEFLQPFSPVARYIGEFAHCRDPNELWFGHFKGIYYMLGGGYILSYDLVEYFAHSQHLMRRSRSEDVTVGIHLHSLELNMDAINETIWKATAASQCGCLSTIILNHKCRKSDMYNMYHSYKRTGFICEYKNNPALAKELQEEYKILGDDEHYELRWN